MGILTADILTLLVHDASLPVTAYSRNHLMQAVRGTRVLSYAEEAVLHEWIRRHHPEWLTRLQGKEK